MGSRESRGDQAETNSEPRGVAKPDREADQLLGKLIAALASLAVVSREGMQARSFAKVLRAYASGFDRLPRNVQQQVVDASLRLLSGLGDEVLTEDLDTALVALSERFRATGWPEEARAVEAARGKLATIIGQLHSRSTRA